MKASDYIVQFLIDQGITDVFGYPGGSVTNLMESFRQREKEIRAHLVYHEQAAAFAACGYAEITGRPGIAYATGGPGATNLLTGIGHAYYDSIPLICLTGNVNTYEAKGGRGIRQRGFQESDIISVARPLTKFCAYVEKPEDLRFYLEKAFHIATTGRPGPVLLDLPMNVQRVQIDVGAMPGYTVQAEQSDTESRKRFQKTIEEALCAAKRPCFVLGKGVQAAAAVPLAQKVLKRFAVPYVTSMIAFDISADSGSDSYFQGFVGAYGRRAANFVLAKSDLIISVGSRLDVRQVGAKRENFAPDAKIIRVDIDAEELKYKVHEDECDFCLDARTALEVLAGIDSPQKYDHWLEICRTIQTKLAGLDDRLPNAFVRALSAPVPAHVAITTDVGQNQVWVAQSFSLKEGQRVLFSGGMGAMGHALPAAIGAFYGAGGGPVFCICGDGGLQMNIQELQFVAREQLPVKIIVFNNNALGMIRHFQEMYFDRVYYQTNPSGGYRSPVFTEIAKAYGIRQAAAEKPEDIAAYREMLLDGAPFLLEIRIREDTYVFPKLEFGKPNQDPQPLIDRGLYAELMALE